MNENLDFENITFKTVNNEGLEVICDVLSSYYDEENDKLYFAFTDYTFTEDNNFKTYIVEAKKEENDYHLFEINDLEIKNKLLKDIQEGEM